MVLISKTHIHVRWAQELIELASVRREDNDKWRFRFKLHRVSDPYHMELCLTSE